MRGVSLSDQALLLRGGVDFKSSSVVVREDSKVVVLCLGPGELTNSMIHFNCRGELIICINNYPNWCIDS